MKIHLEYGRDGLDVDLPPGAPTSFSMQTFTDTDYAYTDESGVTHRYETPDEMPPDVRKRFEDGNRDIV